MPVPAINVVAEPITTAFGIPVTNSMLMGLLGTVVGAAILWHARSRTISGRHTRLSIAVLWLFEWLLTQTEEVLGSRKAALKVAPLGISMFLFIIINNWIEVLPIVGPISWHGTQLFRGLAADMNFTFALAIITLITAQGWAIKRRGFFGSVGRYLRNPFRNPLGAFEGLLELIAELSRTTALSLRLFGNIFGGEVLLLVVGFLSSWAAPIALPLFMAFELFIGAVQAYIFFMLTVTFISLGSKERNSRQETMQNTGVMGAPLTKGA